MDRKCLAYVDLEAARGVLERTQSTGGQLAQRLLTFARGHGRLLTAYVYGDLDNEESRDIKRAGCEVRLTTEDGEGSAPESIALVVEAMEGLLVGPAVETVLILTDDAQLAELVRRLRKAGRYVVAILPESYAHGEPGRSADRFVSIESLLAGEVEALLPERPENKPDQQRRPRRDAPIDFETYDWTRLVVLLRDLESKMPFVGMRWLKNKVIGPHNVGASSPNDRQLVLNKAVEAGLVETYRVGNRDEAGDPVTACRLVRAHDKVKAILDANPAPVVTPPPDAPPPAPPAST